VEFVVDKVALGQALSPSIPFVLRQYRCTRACKLWTSQVVENLVYVVVVVVVVVVMLVGLRLTI
jgi:hypothetical protein